MSSATDSPPLSIQPRAAWLVGIAGFIAFALVGFLGYNGDPTYLHNLFFPAHHGEFYVPIWGFTFLWFCTLLVLLMWYMVRDSLHRRAYRIAILVLSIISVLVSAILYFYLRGKTIPSPSGPGSLVNWPWYGIINFGVIALYLLANEWHWFLRDDPIISAEPDRSREEVAIGEIIAGGILTLLLSLFFTNGPINLLSDNHLGPQLLKCSQPAFNLPWPCIQPFVSSNDPHTLSFIDMILAMGCFVLGPLALVIVTFIRSLSLGADAGLEEVRDTLRRMFHLPTFEILRKLGERLRPAFLPFLIFAAIFFAGVTARENSTFLHLISDRAGCYTLLAHFFCNGKATAGDIAASYENQLGALGSGVASLLSALGAGSLLAYERNSLAQTLRFLRNNVAFTGTFVFCLLSISLSAFNLLVHSILVLTKSQEYPWPFPQPGALGVASFVLLLALLLWPTAKTKAARQANKKARRRQL